MTERAHVAASEWPKRADGSNKTVGEMTPDERRRVFADAAARLQAKFNEPAVREQLARALGEAQ